jgi:hypothetical protein
VASLASSGSFRILPHTARRKGRISEIMESIGRFILSGPIWYMKGALFFYASQNTTLRPMTVSTVAPRKPAEYRKMKT